MCTNETKDIWRDWEHDLLPSPAWEAPGKALNLSIVWMQCELSPLRTERG